VIRAAIDVKLAGLAGRSCWIEGIVSRLPIIAVPREHPGYAVPIDLAGSLYALRAHGAVSVKSACPSRNPEQESSECNYNFHVSAPNDIRYLGNVILTMATRG
jgi:hypothetical protein